ncbi:MAG: type I glyceraldehyde-3-phosphate dehydrogenase [Desulfobulbaceae bacterium]|nr:type I glyceraldehyde-3-phosphate dehydrogenase [Desulfobulbaceae bacterium]
MTKKIAINGMGRIGRAAFKILLENNDFELAAVNDLLPTDTLAYLLGYDSVYGRFLKKITAEQDSLAIDDRIISKYSEKDPQNLPWDKHQIDLVLECTGVFTNREGLEKHIQAGSGKVILSAPAKDKDIPTVVYGANTVASRERIISCGSCTTNCITPIMEVIDRRVGIQKAIMTTVHAYTATQSIVDTAAKKWTRGRAAAINFVPTTTGAALATTRVLPELEGLFDGISVRGPVPIGSLADIVICTVEKTSVEEINSILEEEAAGEKYSGVLGVSEIPLVSTDIIMDPRASVVDLHMTRVVDGDLVKIMSWYDNEWGYSNQMIRTAQQLLYAEE